MIPITVEVLADVVGGELLGEPHQQSITGVAIDSRKVMAGDLFVALPGEHVDGHAYVAQAAAAGAVSILCAAERADDVVDLLADTRLGVSGVVVVDDPMDALTGLGAWVRDTVDPVVVAVTGSNGKTTTKDLTAAAIGAAKVTVANPGSFNNELGLPLTLCLLTDETQVLVCEIGARGMGHIAQAMPIVRPDVAVVTTVTGAHLGEFGSLDAVWEAKGELVEALDVDGVAVLNADLDGVQRHVDRARGRVVTFGLGKAADLRPESIAVGPDGRATVTLADDGAAGSVTFTVPVAGQHNIANSLAALLAAREVGVDLGVAAKGLESAAVSRWRMEVARTGGADGQPRLTIVNDAYNANPQSMRAAIDTATGMAVDGRRWAVLGYMAELGPDEDELHAEVGAHLAASRADGLPAFAGLVVVDGRAAGLARGAREHGFAGVIQQVEDAGAASDAIAGLVGGGDLVLIKASRSQGLEAVAARLTTPGGPAA